MKPGNDFEVKRRVCSGTTRELEALDDLADARLRWDRDVDRALLDVEGGRLDVDVLVEALVAARVVLEAQVMHKAPHRPTPRGMPG